MSKTDSQSEPVSPEFSGDAVKKPSNEIPETTLSLVIDKSIRKVGSVVSWLWIVLMLVICMNVFMKNALGQGSVRFEEIQWHIYALVFLLGLSYSMTFDEHVRVDLLYENFSVRRKAQIETFGIVLFLLPFLVIMLYYAIPFVIKAISDGERSSSPAGLSHYWIIKSALVAGLLLLVASSVSRLHRCVVFLKNGSSQASVTTHRNGG